MEENNNEKSKLCKTYKAPFSCSKDDMDKMKRRRQRAAELGIKLFMLDIEDIQDDRLQELENMIVDNYIDLDKDVPEELKREYIELKKKLDLQAAQNN